MAPSATAPAALASDLCKLLERTIARRRPTCSGRQAPAAADWPRALTAPPQTPVGLPHHSVVQRQPSAKTRAVLRSSTLARVARQTVACHRHSAEEIRRRPVPYSLDHRFLRQGSHTSHMATRRPEGSAHSPLRDTTTSRGSTRQAEGEGARRSGAHERILCAPPTQHWSSQSYTTAPSRDGTAPAETAGGTLSTSTPMQPQPWLGTPT